MSISQLFHIRRRLQVMRHVMTREAHNYSISKNIEREREREREKRKQYKDIRPICYEVELHWLHEVECLRNLSLHDVVQ